MPEVSPRWLMCARDRPQVAEIGPRWLRNNLSLLEVAEECPVKV
jgi:hypothetical protein